MPVVTDESQRRSLSFENLDQVVDDVRALQLHGYTAVGKWDLAQVCKHLVDWMRFPMDGFPEPSLIQRIFYALIRVMIGRSLLKKILAKGEMSEGAPTAPATVYPPGGDPSVAVDQLCDTIDRLQRHRGSFHPSPIFGAMDRDTLIRLQLIHCAHHLSFLLPAE